MRLLAALHDVSFFALFLIDSPWFLILFSYHFGSILATGRRKGGQWGSKGAQGRPLDGQREAKGGQMETKRDHWAADEGPMRANGRPREAKGVPKAGQKEARGVFWGFERVPKRFQNGSKKQCNF